MRAADAYRARRRDEEDCVLVAELEHPLIARLTLKRSTRLDAATWRATPKTGGGTGTAIKLEQVQPSPGDESIYISIHQRQDGRHAFVKLEDALRGRSPLIVLDEADVKDGNRLFYARPRKQSSLAQLASIPTKLWDHPDLAPHGTWTNYSVVPWLCLGRTAAVLLSDEETLCRELPEERIFEHLRLVINCHQARALRPYKAAKQPPEVIAHVLQAGGSVAIHCLAGIHRAAMITACHFLWRHHVLGHTSISCDWADVYRKLISVRPHVSPAYEDILRGYEAHLLGK